MTTPSEFDDRFIVGDLFKPTGMMEDFIRNLPDNIEPDSPLIDYERAYLKSGYKKDIEWVVSQFWKEPNHLRYYLFLNNRTDKLKLTKDEYAQVLQAVESLNSAPWAREYFTSPELEILFQVPILFDLEFKGKKLECKALLDGIRIDHKNKTIEPYDLKTTSRDPLKFEEPFLTYGYFRQALFYTIAITSEASPVRQLLDEGYTLLPFAFVVVDTRLDNTNLPIIWKTNNDTLKKGWTGFSIGKTKYFGLEELLDAHLWHTERQDFSIPKYLSDVNGQMELNI